MWPGIGIKLKPEDLLIYLGKYELFNLDERGVQQIDVSVIIFFNLCNYARKKEKLISLFIVIKFDLIINETNFFSISSIAFKLKNTSIAHL